jgi:hypothetical protein
MATYTAAQLYGAGILGENLTSGVTYTFAFTNPGDSSYFTLETVRDNNGTFTNKPTCAAGIWNAPSNPGLIQSPFMTSAVIPPGNSSITFVPSANVTGTNYYLRGTGRFSLTIS